MNDVPSNTKWGDLGPRVVSGLIMVAVALFGVIMGGIIFKLMIAVCCGLMLWELLRMLNPGDTASPWQIGVGGAVLTLAATWMPVLLALPILLVPGVFAATRLQHMKKTGIAYAALIMVAGYGLIAVRDTLGLPWILWLIILVVASDVLGYFAGKTFGGPKFWPAISPKKTWSGTAAGWAGAALVGLIFGAGSGMVGVMIVTSVILAFAAQMGDIAESAIKRRTGVKDSSDLIPGHGGVLDRFDGIIGAVAAFMVLSLVLGVPAELF